MSGGVEKMMGSATRVGKLLGIAGALTGPKGETVCPLCMESVSPESDETERHHIKPKSRGGSNHPLNLIDLHKVCHRKLHAFYHLHEVEAGLEADTP